MRLELKIFYYLLLINSNCVNTSYKTLFIMFLRQIIVNLFLCLMGFIGIILNRYNILLILISLEVMFLGLNLNFLLLSAFCNDIVGQITSFIVLTVVGAESAIGLAILIAYYRVRGNIKTIQYAFLRN